MNKYIIISLFSFTLLVSCDSFLDVKPYDEINEKDLFKSESGIEKALNGLYLELLNDNLYGFHLTSGMVEILSQHYLTTSMSTETHRFNDLGQYSYNAEQPKALFQSIWGKGYSFISNCNNFITNLEEAESTLTPKHHKLCLGEAIGLRTLMHFDLFRLFAPILNEDTKNEEYIPYYNYVSDAKLPNLKASDFIDSLMRDIDISVNYLSEDYIIDDGVVWGEEFWEYRNFRLNYYAALALKARMCLYIGQKEKAYEIATSLLNNIDPITKNPIEFKSTFKSIRETEINLYEQVFFSELIFAIHHINRDRVYRNNFSNELDGKTLLWSKKDFVIDLFQGENDIRVNSWEASNEYADYNYFVKLRVRPYSSQRSPYSFQTIPILKISELYLIAAETASDDATKFNLLSEFRLRRGYEEGNVTGDLDEVIRLEYRREFLGEGQYFFYLKRHKIAEIESQNGNKYTISGKYVLPVPDEENMN